MTATTAVRPGALRPARNVSSMSLPLLVSCVVPLLLALSSGGWIRLVTSIAAVGAGAALVADGVVGVPALPAPYEPLSEEAAPGLEATG